MLKDLHIKNLVLMESCSIEFHRGLNILTGETGSGKTAILHAIRLLLGQRLDPSLLRFGEKKGSVQATFSIHSQSLISFLTSHGIEIEDSTLILYREVSIEEKTKNFVNDRRVTLSFLQELGKYLVQIVDQNAQHELRTLDSQKELLDLFASLEKEVKEFHDLFLLSKEKKAALHTIEQRIAQKQREWDFCIAQKKELESLPWKEGEEESLFQEYSLFSRSQEVQSKAKELQMLISDAPQNALKSIYKGKQICQSLSSTHSLFQEGVELLNQAAISLEETLHVLHQVLSLFETDPNRHQYLEEKLHTIDQIKRKYGQTQNDWEQYLKTLNDKINGFLTAEDDLHSTSLALRELDEKLDKMAQLLSQKRKKAAMELSSCLEKELAKLNMGYSRLEVRVEPTERSKTGEDSISFWLQANPGEAFCNVKETASGGELSRLLLTIKLCLAEKNSIPTLIFDEIDANVGGETATLIGEKLKNLSSYSQILCITHFPQVAKAGASHLLVQKTEQEGRTFSTVTSLDAKARQKELLRMLGGKAIKS
jgi:DNA repair protein RecN (Recombination protein N)